MKKLLGGFAAIVMSTTISGAPAHAQSKNSTPHALDCMAKAGFTHEMWVARRAGTNAQVAQYIACRDGVSVSQAKQTGRSDGNFDTFKPSKSSK
ncbi:hypothetical protein [Bradyrhizobium sp. Cp5.3]|uniref:hypothetical protein n=1 Tax=Bradyrhizobium sp. Cp5.3 TaxID=443598 RepID=UPI0003F79D46|nr:hypothetical protein [Bradyrhizobium sp. Cp5.3]